MKRNRKETTVMGGMKHLLFIHLAILGLFIGSMESVAQTQAATEQKNNVDVVFEVVEVRPQFPNGDLAGLMKHLKENIRYPKEAIAKGIQGNVVVTFIVEKDGSISNASVVNSPNPLLNDEAVRVISEMPKWNPGKQRGQAVRVRFTVPVIFRF